MDPQEENTLCSECRLCPEDILILICNHNLCLPCASKNLKNEATKSQHTFQTVVCSVCELATVLDPESATTLISMYHELEEENISPQLPQHKSLKMQESPENRYFAKDLPRQPDNMKNSFQNTQRMSMKELPSYCVEHPDEFVNYYCFQCNVSNICAECVIHGSHKGHDVQTIKKAYPLICSKLEELKSNVNSKIEELISSQTKMDASKKEITGQVSMIKKRISDVISELRESISRKEQELLTEAEEFHEQNTKQIDHLLRLANGRAMNLSEHTQTIKEALNNYDQKTACEFYAKKYQEINESNDTEIPQLETISAQAQSKFEVKAKNINDIMERLQNFKLNVGNLHLQFDGPERDERRPSSGYEERGKMTNSHVPSNLPSNIFDLGYKATSSLKSSVAKTMNKIKKNLVTEPQNDHQKQYYEAKLQKNPGFRNTMGTENSIQREHNIYDEEEDEDYEFMYK